MGDAEVQPFEVGQSFEVHQTGVHDLLAADVQPSESGQSFEMLQTAGKDAWLDQVKGIPRPILDDGSGGDWQRAKEIRLSWMTDEPVRAKYLSAGSLERAIELYGLPMSPPERRGPFTVQRFQRVAFQHWVETVPGMPAAGSVVPVLGGDVLKEAALIPPSAAQPMPYG